MTLSILSEILYTGICYEKGRFYSNYWKPRYKKNILSQIRIWNQIIFEMRGKNSENNVKLLEDLKLLSQKYNLCNYNKYINLTFNYNQLSSSYDDLSIEQKAIIFIMEDLLKEFERLVKKIHAKKKAYYILVSFHNFPRTLFSQNDLINRSFKTIQCNEAINYVSDSIAEVIKDKYKKYIDTIS